MKPALQLRLSQQLTMTPQLQQAIRLLQLPVVELQAQLQQALAENVMLELVDPVEFRAESAADSSVVAGDDQNLWNDQPSSGSQTSDGPRVEPADTSTKLRDCSGSSKWITSTRARRRSARADRLDEAGY